MFDLNKMAQEQIKLSRKLTSRDSFDSIEDTKTIAGVDQAYIGHKIISTIVICEFPTMKILEVKHAIVDSPMPFVPGYVSFRESPAVVEAYHLLERDFDLLLVDGNGILHPRKMGLAAHLGLILDKPTIGIAKNLMCGEVKDDKVYVDSELRGMVVKTKVHSNPLYVSPGNLISIKSATEIVAKCIKAPHKLPEPLHLAHQYSSKTRQQYEKRLSE